MYVQILPTTVDPIVVGQGVKKPLFYTINTRSAPKGTSA